MPRKRFGAEQIIPKERASECAPDTHTPPPTKYGCTRLRTAYTSATSTPRYWR